MRLISRDVICMHAITAPSQAHAAAYWQGAHACCMLLNCWGAYKQRRSCVRYGPCEAAALQERMKRAVALLGEEEVRTILEKEGRIEARRLRQAPTVLFSLHVACVLATHAWAGSCMSACRDRSTPPRR